MGVGGKKKSARFLQTQANLKKISSSGPINFSSLLQSALLFTAMPLSAVGIGGLLLTALAVLDDVDQSLNDDLLPLIGLVVLWFDLASSTPRSLEDGNNDETVFCRGP